MQAKRIIDVSMTLLLLLLMSLQVTEQDGHEYIGMVMVLIVIVHQYLNRKWFASILKGRYSAVRILSLTVNISLIVAFTFSAVSGMMIAETFTFMNVESLTEWARTTHLFASYWSFVLMGLHAGLHWAMMAGRIKAKWPGVMGVMLSGYGLYRFIEAKIIDYLVLETQFAFIDYDLPALPVLINNTAMLSFFVLLGYEANKIAAGISSKRWGNILHPVIVILCACAVGAVLFMLIGADKEEW